MGRRTPRNYSGTKNPAKSISELLPIFALELAKKTRAPRDEIFKAWKELLGEKMAPFTSPVSLEDDVLTVKVKSSTLYSLLAVHEKRRLLAGLQKKFSIRDIVFRIG